MKAYPAQNLKLFMSSLLSSELFDDFFLESATITTFNTFSIDGKIRKDFFPLDERDQILENYSKFSKVRPYIYEIIKGKNTPISFNLVLYAPSDMYPENIAKDVKFVLNIRYEAKKLTCISAISRSDFTLDRSADELWDEILNKFLSSSNL